MEELGLVLANETVWDSVASGTGRVELSAGVLDICYAVYREEGDLMDNKPVMLIVDDVNINRTVLAQFFHDDYRIVEAENGQEALSMLEQEAAHIVLVDIMMPVMDGLEFMSVLKSNDQYKGLPVVAMTTHGDLDGQTWAVELGAADFITKPFNPTIVHQRVKNVMAASENEWRRVAQLAADKQLAEVASYVDNDGLTGLYNREAFYRKASRLLKDNQDVEYEIIYLDVYSFKVINDLFTMETGNLVLKTAAYYFDVLTSNGGVCGRVESDHFVLCVPRGQVRIEQLLEGIDSTVVSLGISHNIVFYAGIYEVENTYMPVDQMCDRARMAMNKVKGSYLHRYAYYDDKLKQIMQEEQMIVRDMEFALQERQFDIYLQPVYDAETGKIVSAEALVRWQHPFQGVVSPGKFISVFERNGFIVRLDRYVWEMVCDFMASLRETTGKLLPVSVNVSRLNLYNLDLLDFLLGLIKEHDLSPEFLHLEITEEAYTQDSNQLIEAVGLFRQSGFQVSLDDFGKGNSPISMLKELPVDTLKVDLGFMRKGERADRGARIMGGVVEMAVDLDMDIIVEGVENQDDFDFAVQKGARLIQGYYYAKPMPREVFAALCARELGQANT